MAAGQRSSWNRIALLLALAAFALVLPVVVTGHFTALLDLLGIVAALIPIIYIYFIHKLDLYGTGKMKYIVVSAIWGMCAFQLCRSGTAVIATLLEGRVSYEMRQIITTPALEELVKALILFLLVMRSSFLDMVDGAIYGFAVGISFAIAENLQHITPGTASSLWVTLLRVGMVNIIHASSSTLVGVILAPGYRKVLRELIVLSGTLLAIGLHAYYNALILFQRSFLPVVLFVLGVIVIVRLLMRRASRDEKRRIKQSFASDAHVTAAESRSVMSFETYDERIAPALTRQLGADKSSQIREMIRLQARLGLLMHSAAAGGPAAREAEIKELRADLDRQRNSIGAYAMLYYRSIFPSDDTALWNLLEQRISRNRGQAGSGLWQALDQRLRHRPDGLMPAGEAHEESAPEALRAEAPEDRPAGEGERNDA